ncbi:LptF/LptG family permease [Poriferisphaera sp. WC338]|uniref:LptF/LptG family permease n=1 Tax=Poriferisphaera sp. WC338 TaxID=3425129 RepID=UPI003D817669
MKTLSYYIIKQFLINFVILLAVLMLLFVLVDLIIDMDDFVKAGANWAAQRNVASVAAARDLPASELTRLLDTNAGDAAFANTLGISVEDVGVIKQAVEPGTVMSVVGTAWHIIDYYAPIMLLIYVFFSGLIVTAAMGFTFSALLRTRELSAMISSGISLYRVAMPIVIVGGILSLINLPIQEYAVPALASKITRDKLDLKRNKKRDVRVEFVRDGAGNLISAGNFMREKDPAQLENMTILVRDEEGLARTQIRATTGVWDENEGGWRLIQGQAFSPPMMGVEGVDLLQGPVSFFKTELTPRVLHLRQTSLFKMLLSIDQLEAMQANPAISLKDKGGITQIIWSRFSLVVLNVLVLVMGLPYFLLRVPKNMLMQGLKAAGLCVGAWAGGIMVLQAGASFLPPISAAWFPVIVYLPVSAWLLHTIKT